MDLLNAIPETVAIFQDEEGDFFLQLIHDNAHQCMKEEKLPQVRSGVEENNKTFT